jgi:hypothetical protein
MEQIVLLAFFVLVALANAIVSWLRRRKGAGRPEPEEAPAPPLPELPRLPLPPSARVRITPPPEALVPGVRGATPVASPPAPRRRSARGGLGTPADVRRAVVAMTLLGPCRALEAEREVRTSRPAGPPA